MLDRVDMSVTRERLRQFLAQAALWGFVPQWKPAYGSGNCEAEGGTPAGASHLLKPV